jgi:hypothetical protein
MNWFSPGEPVHVQAPGQDCSTCTGRHTLAYAVANRRCPGPAHEWPIPRVCVFCRLDWKVPAGGPGVLPGALERYVPQVSVPVPQ